MKRIITISAFLLVCLAACAVRVPERVFLTTDRNVYVAGDRVWCSAFCFNAADRRLSDLSSIAYYELHSTDGMALNGRIALVRGRGAAGFYLPQDLPTGNYKLISYTAQGRNEADVDFASAGTLISVINTSSTARVRGGVSVSDKVQHMPQDTGSEGGIGIVTDTAEISSRMSVSLSNTMPSDATLSVSVYHDDSLTGVVSPTLASKVRGMKAGDVFSEDYIPEYDGEIIRAKVTGLDPSQLEALSYRYAFISAPGDMADIYTSRISKDGSAQFFTNNIFGSKELVCEIEGLPEDAQGHLELLSPFADVNPGDIEPLTICPSQAEAVMARKASMMIGRVFDADTLCELLPMRRNHLFGNSAISYRLDDYTRFPLMTEVITEFIPELRVRKVDGDALDIQVRLKDSFGQQRFSHGTSLILLDGTPVFDHSKVVSYDPLLVEAINIYPYVYFIGSRYFNGVVDIVTFKRNMPSMKFGDNVRVYDFDGASFPVAFTCNEVNRNENYPDLRQTVMWHPALEIGAGQSKSIECVLPSYPGHFRVVVEGVTTDGTPLRAVHEFDVR